jgi:GNAT superfamily N-acetyltransferase
MISGELQIEDDPRLDEVAALEEQLHRHNVAVTGCDDGRWLAIFVRDGEGQIVAGLHGWTWGGTGFVRTLWVQAGLRGQGLGARLLATAEREAAGRGCREMQLDTHEYQAPGFYLRCGYERIGELPGWPGEESTRIFFRVAVGSPSRGGLTDDTAPSQTASLPAAGVSGAWRGS